MVAPMPRIVLRTAQLAFALAVVLNYSVDLVRESKVEKYNFTHWLFIEVVAALSFITSFVFLVFVKNESWSAYIWDFILCVCWSAAFGVFAKKFLHYMPATKSDIHRLKTFIWIDMINMNLWFTSTVAGVVISEFGFDTPATPTVALTTSDLESGPTSDVSATASRRSKPS